MERTLTNRDTNSFKAPRATIVAVATLLLILPSCSRAVPLGRYAAPDKSIVEILPDNRIRQSDGIVGSYTEYKISGDKVLLKVPGDWMAAYKIEGTALIELGRRRRYDWVVPEAEKYRKAAEAGDAEAQHSLGVAYAAGVWGVYQDRAEAERWFKKAADQDHPTAELNLANLYSSSSDPKFWDGGKAVRYALRAIEHTSKERDDVEYGNYAALAAAYARNGDFEKAVATQTDAIRRLNTARINQDIARAEILPDYEKALRSFKNKKPLPDKSGL